VSTVGVGWIVTTGTSSSGTLQGGAGILALLGTVATAAGIGTLPRYWLCRRGAFASGTVQATSAGPDQAPLSETPALAWAVRIREHRGLSGRGARPQIYTERGGTEYVLETETATYRFDASETTVDLWPPLGSPDIRNWRVTTGGQPPAAVQAFTAARELPAQKWKRIYEEVSVAPGETATVLRPEATDPGETTLVPLSRAELQSRIQRRLRVGAVGAVGLLVGLGLLAWTMGAV
jgi:hypothetical protein